MVIGTFCDGGVFGKGQTLKIASYILHALGVIGISINCPIYNMLLKNIKAAYAYDVITLAAEICEDN